VPPSPRRRRPKFQPPELPEIEGGLLDWRHGHWSEVRAQCRYCPDLTNLRDIYGRPSHKTCAEEAARQWLKAQRERYENERLNQK
jgi:hypothetical protein